MKLKRIWLFRIIAVLILVIIGAVMLVIGRGHTVYLDNRTLEYNGQSYEAPYSVTVYVGGEEIASLDADERGMSTCIGQTFYMYLEIIEAEDGEPQLLPFALPLPYSLDGVIINLPGYLAGLPEEAYLTEFIPAPEPETSEDEVIPGSDEVILGDI